MLLAWRNCVSEAHALPVELELHGGDVGHRDSRADPAQLDGETTWPSADLEDPVALLDEATQETSVDLEVHAVRRRPLEAIPLASAVVVGELRDQGASYRGSGSLTTAGYRCGSCDGIRQTICVGSIAWPFSRAGFATESISGFQQRWHASSYVVRCHRTSAALLVATSGTATKSHRRPTGAS